MKFLFMAIFGLFLGAHSAEIKKPNIIFILVDDMGFSDLGCFGGEIKTPTIDSLAKNGLRFTQFYNTAKCFTSRASLLSGVYQHQCEMPRKHGEIKNAVTLGEVLKTVGYRTLASGKHHGTENLYERGFDHYYGLRDGACNFWNPGKKRPGEGEPGRKTYRTWCDDGKTMKPFTPTDKKFYATDAFTNKALEWLDEDETKKKPFFLYLSYNAPHYPLHAWPADIAKYKGYYEQGYNAIVETRMQRLKEMGLLTGKLSSRPKIGDWQGLAGEAKAKEILRMQIYAAMLDRVDQNIKRVVDKLKEQGRFENTLIMFTSDNGACAEKSGARVFSTKIEDFGKVSSYETVGNSWATVQNTPFKFWKNYSHEGGICSPFVVSWPGRIAKPGSIVHQPAHLIDIMSTVVDITGAVYPETFKEKKIVPMQGTSLQPAFGGDEIKREKPLFWQWSRGGAIRQGDFKAVFWGNEKTWELYNIKADRNEAENLAATQPERLQSMIKEWHSWYKNVTTN